MYSNVNDTITPPARSKANRTLNVRLPNTTVHRAMVKKYATPNAAVGTPRTLPYRLAKIPAQPYVPESSPPHSQPESRTGDFTLSIFQQTIRPAKASTNTAVRLGRDVDMVVIVLMVGGKGKFFRYNVRDLVYAWSVWQHLWRMGMVKIRIVTLQGPDKKYDGPVSYEKNVEWTVARIRTLGDYRPDVICLTEVFTWVGLELPTPDRAEPVPGPTTETMMTLAREVGSAIICPLIEQREGDSYNTAVVIDSSGRIVGRYDKIRPTETELERGIVPGRDEPTVIDLCGVKTGYQICFDANWTGQWLDLKRAGAQVIFFCSAFSAGTLLNGLATVLRVPVAAATITHHCRILDRVGRLLAHQTPYHDHAMADVVIDQPLCHLDFQWDKMEAIRREDKDVSIFTFDGNGTFELVGSRDPSVLQSVIEKHGLLDVDDYLRRAERAQDRARG